MPVRSSSILFFLLFLLVLLLLPVSSTLVVVDVFGITGNNSTGDSQPALFGRPIPLFAKSRRRVLVFSDNPYLCDPPPSTALFNFTSLASPVPFAILAARGGTCGFEQKARNAVLYDSQSLCPPFSPLGDTAPPPLLDANCVQTLLVYDPSVKDGTEYLTPMLAADPSGLAFLEVLGVGLDVARDLLNTIQILQDPPTGGGGGGRLLAIADGVGAGAINIGGGGNDFGGGDSDRGSVPTDVGNAFVEDGEAVLPAYLSLCPLVIFDSAGDQYLASFSWIFAAIGGLLILIGISCCLLVCIRLGQRRHALMRGELAVLTTININNAHRRGPHATPPRGPAKSVVLTEMQAHSLPDFMFGKNGLLEAMPAAPPPPAVRASPSLLPRSSPNVPLPPPSAGTPPPCSPAMMTQSSANNHCVICLEDYTAGEVLKLIPLCGHAYHKGCLVPWLTERSATCPLCKGPAFLATSSLPPSSVSSAPLPSFSLLGGASSSLVPSDHRTQTLLATMRLRTVSGGDADPSATMRLAMQVAARTGSSRGSTGVLAAFSRAVLVADDMSMPPMRSRGASSDERSQSEREASERERAVVRMEDSQSEAQL